MADYISRERLLEKLGDSEVAENDRIDIGYNAALQDVKQYLTEMPTADVHPIVDTCERCKKKIISVDDYNILIKNHNYFILCGNCMEDFEVFMGT